jgi:hypothetical protein
MPILNTRVLSVFAPLLALLAYSIVTFSSDVPSAVDLTKPSDGLSNDNARLVLHGVPSQESAAKNELQLTSPALVVGPAMEGLGQPRLCRWRHEMLGQQVQVEGLALGVPPQQSAHMTTQRVVYEGGMIFVKGADFAKSEATGKLVHIVGKLRLNPESVMQFGGHDPITVNKYYYLDVENLRVIESVTEPRLVAPQLHK